MGIDATASFTLHNGQVSIFATVGHRSAYFQGIHVAKRGTRLEALEAVRRTVREQFGRFSKASALGVGLRHDHSSPFWSDNLRREIQFLGPEFSSAFVRDSEGNGSIERFLRTLKNELLQVRPFDTLKELAEALEEFRQHYNEQRLVERRHFPPPRQVHRTLLALEPAA